MRNLFVFLFLSIACTAVAQTAKPSKPFKVAASIGYAAPTDRSGAYTKAGFVYSIEPQYEIVKNIDLGVRLEQAFIRRSEVLDNFLYYDSKAQSTLSALITANYTIDLSCKFRPYVGVGGGLYLVAASEQQYQVGSVIASYPLPTTTNLGGIGRVGVKIGIVHVEGAYNLIGDTSVKNTSTNLTLVANNSYFSLKAGLTIGGSR